MLPMLAMMKAVRVAVMTAFRTSFPNWRVSKVKDGVTLISEVMAIVSVVIERKVSLFV